MKEQTNILKISVITPSFNQAQFIERTIQSVLSQNYPNLEYWIIDGQSQDNTLEILYRYRTHLHWISEPDKGQAEAINKGFRRANGDIVCWINADDEYMPGALHKVATFFNQHPDAMFLYGDAQTIDHRSRSYGRRGNVRPATFEDLVFKGDFIVQPAAFWRRQLLDQVGLLDESFKYCLDYEFWLRISQRYPLHYLPTFLARERFHDQAKTTQATLERIHEIETVAHRYGNKDLPSRFKAERAAAYVYQMLYYCLRANWRQVTYFWTLAVCHFSLSPRFVPHLIALIFGSKVITQMRLYYDLVRLKLHLNRF